MSADEVYHVLDEIKVRVTADVAPLSSVNGSLSITDNGGWPTAGLAFTVGYATSFVQEVHMWISDLNGSKDLSVALRANFIVDLLGEVVTSKEFRFLLPQPLLEVRELELLLMRALTQAKVVGTDSSVAKLAILRIENRLEEVLAYLVSYVLTLNWTLVSGVNAPLATKLLD